MKCVHFYVKKLTRHAKEVLKNNNIAIGDHKAESLTPEDLKRASKVVCMTESHRTAVLDRFPDLFPKDSPECEKVTLLREESLPDPYPEGNETEAELMEKYVNTFNAILPAVKAL